MVVSPFRLPARRHFAPALVCLIALSAAGTLLFAGNTFTAHAAANRYVAVDGVDSGNCSNSASPCLTVQYSADMAQAGDSILIAGGVYTGVQMREDEFQMVYISRTLSFKGSYSRADNYALSDPAANPTILDAQGGGGVFRITVASSIANLTVQNGASGTAGSGGNILADVLTLERVQVLSGTATLFGGGVSANALTVRDSLFQNNSSGAFAGAIGVMTAADISGTQFINNNVADGEGGGEGAGVWSNDSLWLTNTQFLSNTAGSFGGGAYVIGPAVVSGGLFQNNHAGTNSGGMLTSGRLLLTGTHFIANSSGNAGGIGLTSNNARIVNALFARNSAAFSGAAIASIGATSVVIHTTISSPTLASSSAIYVSGGKMGITNTIITSHSIGIHNIGGGTAYEDYNLFFGNGVNKQGIFARLPAAARVAAPLFSGAHDVSGDPRFASPPSDNYRLIGGSPAIDAGINLGITTDIDGNPRVHNGIPDIGAYEWAGIPTAVSIVNLSAASPTGYTRWLVLALAAGSLAGLLILARRAQSRKR